MGMIGFEFARLSEDEVLQKIAEIQDISALPLDEEGVVIEGDSQAAEAARHIRLLLQRLLDVNPDRFLVEMRRLFFHLFAIDHDHYRDLLFQASRLRPMEVRDFAVEFLLSDDVIFLEDQWTLHDLIDVLETYDLAQFPPEMLTALKALWLEPFFRIPGVQARLIKWLHPIMNETDIRAARTLFEMGLIPAKELTWAQHREHLVLHGLIGSALEEPEVRMHVYAAKVTLEDFEDLRWSVGIDGTPHALKFRMLGAALAAGPRAKGLFIEASEAQPETAFHREVFETTAQRAYFWAGLDRWRESVIRDAHLSRDWFTQLPVDKIWPWTAPLPPDPWPREIRSLTGHWGEFANPAEGSEFAIDAAETIKALDTIGDEIAELLRNHPWPTLKELDRAQILLGEFLKQWDRLWPRARPHLDLIP